MAALSVNDRLVVIQSGGSLLTYEKGSQKPPFAVQIQKPEKKALDKNVPNQTGVESGRDSILAFSLSPDARHLVACDDYKQMCVWGAEYEGGHVTWTLLSKRVLPRRCSSLAFTSDGNTVVVADKSGDCYSYSLTDTDISGEGKLLAGHISMLLDVCLCGGSDNFLVTCDRDEKIRVSHFPNSYNIQAYCLGHTEFVSRLGYFKKEDMLISGGGDGTLRLWNYMTGEELFNLDLKPEFTSCDPVLANEKPQPSDDIMDTCPSPDQVPANHETAEVKATPLSRSEGVADVKCLACCQKNSMLAVSCAGRSGILLYRLTREGGSPALSKCQQLVTSARDVWDLSFDEEGNLWCLQADKSVPVCVWRYLEEIKQYVPVESCDDESVQPIRSIVTDLNTNQKEFFEAAFIEPTNSTPLHKVRIDNVTEYQERKQQKIAEKLSKRKGPKGGHCETEDKKIKS